MSRKPTSPQPTRPFRSVSSQLTLDHRAAVEEASAAELRGDWATAFEHHRSVPMFRESVHGAMLRVLADLGDDAPPWLVTRFLTVLAHRLEMYGRPRRSGRVLAHVVPLLYPHGIPFEPMGCEHPERVGAMIFGRDWVLRQADVYDLGGLEDLLGMPESIGARLKGRYVAEWAAAPMGGYRVVGADGRVMTVADAMTGQEHRLLDLGLTRHHRVGSHVLGRVVPMEPDSDDGPDLLFDWQPLGVDARIARQVASRPDRWLDVIAARTRSRALEPAFSHLEDASFSADLPRHAWGALLGHPLGDRLPRPPSTMVAEALKAALVAAGDGAVDRHLVSELLLDELVDERLVARFATGEYRVAWQRLARVLPDHAVPACRHALWLIDASSGTDDLAG